MFTKEDREKWEPDALADFDMRHAAGGPYDDVDVKNAFIRGCRRGYSKKTAEKVTSELLSVDALQKEVSEAVWLLNEIMDKTGHQVFVPFDRLRAFLSKYQDKETSV